jgi:hypothetical protein
MAQVKISCSDLAWTKWKVVADYTDEWGIHYTGSPKGEFYQFTTKEKIWYQKDGNTATYQYYITDKIPTEFEFNKVGSKEKGRYYIEYNSALDVFYCWRITKFDKKAKAMTRGYLERGSSIVSYFVNYQMTDEISPTKPKTTYDTPVEQIHTKEYDVLARETSKGKNTSTSGKTSTSGNSSTGKSTSTGGGTTIKDKTSKYVDPNEQLTPRKE